MGITLLFPFMQVHALPGPPYIYVIWTAVLGNVAAFSMYSYLQILEKQKKAMEDSKTKNALLDEEVGSGSDESDDFESETSSNSKGCCCSVGTLRCSHLF